MTFGHGGNILAAARKMQCSPAEFLDMSSNINPLGPPPGLLDFLRANLETVTRLPEVDGRQTAAHFADYLGLNPNQVLPGNGTTQFIYALPKGAGIQKCPDCRPDLFRLCGCLRRPPHDLPNLFDPGIRRLFARPGAAAG